MFARCTMSDSDGLRRSGLHSGTRKFSFQPCAEHFITAFHFRSSGRFWPALARLHVHLVPITCSALNIFRLVQTCCQLPPSCCSILACSFVCVADCNEPCEVVERACECAISPFSRRNYTQLLCRQSTLAPCDVRHDCPQLHTRTYSYIANCRQAAFSAF